jgi:hypothetical protein
MGNILVRIGVVIGVLVGVQAGFLYVLHLRNPTVVQPLRPLESFDKVVRAESTGDWVGKDQKLDDQEFNYAQLDADLSRVYTNRDNRSMSVLIGVYSSPAIGLYHNPFNCYDTHGFVLKNQVRKPLQAANRPDTEISLTTWEQKGQKYAIAFWYEVGNYTMFERQDLLATQWAMRGKSKWPVMFKVLIQAPAGDSIDQAKVDVLEMAKAVREWLGTVEPPAE